ncbi:MAG TPA: peptide-methionine (R)-S-oxide reductase MsrB, partial [Saprospiraceae bacterium]|nr:peptide-methionine (R)-S-oxide reductase MsrB [Saprospiraceae bacterium]
MNTIKVFIFIAMLMQYQCKSSKQDPQVSSKIEKEELTTLQKVDKSLPYFINMQGDTIQKVIKSDAEWKAQLTEFEYYVLRSKGTERAFTGDLLKIKKEGLYCCKGCGYPLFRSQEKYESGTGWPSFYKPADPNAIAEDEDYDIGYKRTEVMCGKCGGHLGHVFDDGPR